MGSVTVVRPPALRPGARVALVAPAGPLLERDDLTRSCELCHTLGFEPVLGTHAGARAGFFAGTDAQRLADLNAALADPAIDAVWCIRGGVGLTRILDRVDYDGFARRPKPVIGFSDVTALLNALHRVTGAVTFHGPMARAAMSAFSRQHFERVLGQAEAAGRLGCLPVPADVLVPQRERIVSLVPGTAEGPLVGGNLTLLQTLVGTRFLPDLDGAILFLEDVGEDLYRVDRMFTQLKLAGVLEKVHGVVFGTCAECGPGEGFGSLTLEEILADHVKPLRVPAWFGAMIGHQTPQWTIPVGAEAEIDAAKGTIRLLAPAVR